MSWIDPTKSLISVVPVNLIDLDSDRELPQEIKDTDHSCLFWRRQNFNNILAFKHLLSSKVLHAFGEKTSS